MHLAYTPVLLGSGESPLLNLDLNALGYQLLRHYLRLHACADREEESIAVLPRMFVRTR